MCAHGVRCTRLVYAHGVRHITVKMGGFLGGLCGGIVSDFVFKGRRGPAMCLFSLATIPFSVGALNHIAVMDQPSSDAAAAGLWTMQLLFFMLGFATFAPHMLIGLIARELTPATMHSSAGCLAKAAGQLGGVFAGFPISFIAQRYGWAAMSWLFGLSGLLAAISFFPLWAVQAAADDNVKKARNKETKKKN